jgi:hypothetical protein
MLRKVLVFLDFVYDLNKGLEELSVLAVEERVQELFGVGIFSHYLNHVGRVNN